MSKWEKDNRKGLAKPTEPTDDILEVEGYALKKVHKCLLGTFHSKHKLDDVRKWLESITLKDNSNSGTARSGTFNDIFGRERVLFEVRPDGTFSDIKDEDNLVGFYTQFGGITKGEYFDLGIEKDFRFDDTIQKFIDGEPQREMDKINYRFRDFMGNVQGMKDTALQLLNDFKKVVETDDVENLSEVESHIYHSLKHLSSLEQSS